MMTRRRRKRGERRPRILAQLQANPDKWKLAFLHLPNHQRVACINGELSRNTYKFCAHVFARLGADLHAHSVLFNKNFCIGAQSEVH